MKKKHLGGHLNITHIDEGALDYIIGKIQIKSMIDIGCGPGGMVKVARSKGLKAIGIDGDRSLDRYNSEDQQRIFFHDYTVGELTFPISDVYNEFDLAWSVEFLEHVEEQYIPNFMHSFSQARYVVATHALPGEIRGHHHVNLKPPEYWHEVFGKYGFEWDRNESFKIRKHSTMAKGFMRRTGMFYRKRC